MSEICCGVLGRPVPLCWNHSRWILEVEKVRISRSTYPHEPGLANENRRNLSQQYREGLKTRLGTGAGAIPLNRPRAPRFWPRLRRDGHPDPQPGYRDFDPDFTTVIRSRSRRSFCRPSWPEAADPTVTTRRCARSTTRHGPVGDDVVTPDTTSTSSHSSALCSRRSAACERAQLWDASVTFASYPHFLGAQASPEQHEAADFD